MEDKSKATGYAGRRHEAAKSRLVILRFEFPPHDFIVGQSLLRGGGGRQGALRRRIAA